MPFLGQGLQRTPRSYVGALQFVGMDYVSASGAFSWVVPTTNVDVVDIIAVGPGGTAQGNGGNGSSGAVCVRIGKSVVGGQVISGSIGIATYDGSQSTTVDGMTAPGGSWGLSQPVGTIGTSQPIGGDINLYGIMTGGLRNAIQSLLPGSSVRIVDPLYPASDATANAAGIWPGGGGNGYLWGGANGGVFFIMYRRAS